MIKRWISILTLNLVIGCSTLNSCDECWWYNQTANYRLHIGLDQYHNGNYDRSIKELNLTLKLNPTDEEHILAHKHLAFIYCISGKERICYEEFKHVLEVNPKFELSPEESGHPIWGPVFRRAKQNNR